HSARALGRGLNHPQGALLLQRHVVHGGEQTDSPQPLFGERLFRARRRVGARGIDHEESDDSPRMPCDRRGYRSLVAGDTGNERRAAHAVRVHLAYPSVRKLFSVDRIVPLESPIDAGRVVVESLKEKRREEVTVGVVDQKVSRKPICPTRCSGCWTSPANAVGCMKEASGTPAGETRCVESGMNGFFALKRLKTSAITSTRETPQKGNSRL